MFALEFYPQEFISASKQTKSLDSIAGPEYRFSGEVIVSEPGVQVLDVGILCYHDGKLTNFPPSGTFISGRLSLNVDPFYWYETLAQRSNMPNLFYRWRIEKIILETTLWTISEERGGKVIKRVPGPRTFEEIQRTNAAEDDDGRAYYELKCILLSDNIVHHE